MLLEQCSKSAVGHYAQWFSGSMAMCWLAVPHIALREALQATYAKQYGPLGALQRIPLS